MVDPHKIEKAIADTHDQTSFVQRLLIDTLGWSMDERARCVDDISYEWTTDELRADDLRKHVVNNRIYQIQPPAGAPMPWGVFIVEFRSADAFTTGRGMTGPLRRILRGLVPKARGRSAHLPAWDRENLLFICTHNYEHFRFAYFKAPPEGTKTAPLATFGWSPGVPARTVCEFNLGKLEWPDRETTEGNWAAQWAGAFDVEKVTKEFYKDYDRVFHEVEGLIDEQGDHDLETAEDLRMFTQSLFNRLMFLRFVERKGWLIYQGDTEYLRALHAAGGIRGRSLYRSRIHPLFFEGLAVESIDKPEVFGKTVFLNGGLFEKAEIDGKVRDLPNEVFDRIIGSDGLFYRYNFTVEESTPLDIEVAVDPEMLGKVFEKLVTGRHETGSYYTPRQVVSFMCREALKGHLSEQTDAGPETVASLVDDHEVGDLSVTHARQVLGALDGLKAVDPACGSGAYLLGLLHEMVTIYRLLYSEKLTQDAWSLFKLKQQIICNNLYGVDLDPFATSIAMLRLWLSLMVEFDQAQPPPLPNLDFKIETGDALLGPCEPIAPTLEIAALHTLAEKLVEKKDHYLTAHGDRKRQLKTEIDHYTDAILDALQHAHRKGIIDWRVHFAEVFVKNGGFNVVLANPPYVNMVQMDASDSNYRDVVRGIFSTATGGFDLFVPFVQRGVQLLAQGGTLAYITPNKILSAEYAEDLRLFLRERTTLRSVTDLSRIPVFSASVYPVITIAQKAPSGADHVVSILQSEAESSESVDIVFSHEAPMSIADLAGHRWSALLEKDAQLLLPMLQAKKRLADVAEVCGAATVSEAYEWKDAVIDNGQRLRKANPKRYRPFIVSGNIRRFAHTWDTKTVRYIKATYSHPVLDIGHTALSARRKRQVAASKVVVSGMSKRPTCFWDVHGVAAGKSTVLVIPKHEDDGPFIAAVLNSAVMERFYQFLFGSLSLAGGYLRFGPPQLRQLPVPEAKTEEKAAIVNLVLSYSNTPVAKRRQVEKELNRRVAALYGVSWANRDEASGSARRSGSCNTTASERPKGSRATNDSDFQSDSAVVTGRLASSGEEEDAEEADPDDDPEEDDSADYRPPPIDDTERADIMVAIRAVFSEVKFEDGLDREDALHAVAEALGYQRLGPRIREVLERDFLAAALRGIIETKAGIVYPSTRSINDYDREDLKKALLSVIRTAWWERDDAIRAAARYLGFAHAGKRIQAAFKSAITGLLRQNRLESDGSLIRRAD